MNDLRLAFRQLGKSPGFAAIAVLTLALGIGLSTSSFSMANAFLLRNVPYPDADELVRVFGTSRQSRSDGHAPGNLIDLRAQATSFAGFALYNSDAYSLGEPGQPAERVAGMEVTADFFDVVGVQPTVGRAFAPNEDQPEQPPVVVLTHRAWVRRYAQDPDILGRTVRLNARPYTIIGVLPPSFEAPLVWGPVEFLAPRTMHPTLAENRRDNWLHAVARLNPGVTLRQAQAEMDTLSAQLQQAYPRENAGRGVRLVGLAHSNMDSVSRSLLWLMTGIALAMLLIACGNLASLQVARALARGREFAIRSALGGARHQLMVPLFLESLLLAAAGGAAGLLVAWWSNQIIGSLLLINNEPGFYIPIDERVLVFAIGSALVSGVAFGLAPAWISSRAPAADALKEGSRSATTSRSHQRLKRTLIIGELAVALTLVAVAAAFGVGAKSFMRRQVGWNMDGLFSGYLALPYAPYGENGRTAQFYRELLPKLAAIPGVEQAVVCTNLPLFALGPTVPLSVEGAPVDDPQQRPLTQVGSVTAAYFEALQIPLREGRGFTDDITSGDPAVAVINESFAKRFWPNESALGRRLKLGDNDTWIEVIGVVNDVRMMGNFSTPATLLQLYRPIAQSESRYVTLALRTAVAPDTLTRSVREAVASLDADLPVAAPGSLRSSFERNLSNLNLVIVNLGLSAGMGLLIAAVGLFGVISQLTTQRTRDIGVRMALGANHSQIMRMILGEGVLLLVIGIVIGIPAYYALSTVLRGAMPEMQLPGVWLLAVNVAVISLTMLAACWLPARRATRVDPVEALRAD